jgi:hypothetical protein
MSVGYESMGHSREHLGSVAYGLSVSRGLIDGAVGWLVGSASS